MEEKKATYSYTITHFSDGSIEIADSMREDTDRISPEECYNNVEEVAKTIERKRIENAALVGAYNAVAKFFKDARAAQQEAASQDTETL